METFTIFTRAESRLLHIFLDSTRLLLMPLYSRIDISLEFSFGHTLEFSKLAVAFVMELSTYIFGQYSPESKFNIVPDEYCSLPEPDVQDNHSNLI